MIVEYHRPKSIESALKLLERSEIRTLPLAGGTLLTRPSPEPVSVVDLQELGLDHIELRDSRLVMGAMARLQQVLDFPGVQPGLQQAIRHTTNPQIRNASTVAGALVAADGRSPFAAAMLALDATIYFRSLSSGQIEVSLGEYYSLRREYQHGFLIIQLSTLINVDLVYEYVARTPADLPLVSTVLARWPSGRVRLVVGGFGSTPTLAMDGPDAGGVSSAAQNVCDRLEGDWIDTGHRISAEYCREVAGTLAKRCLGRMGS